LEEQLPTLQATFGHLAGGVLKCFESRVVSVDEEMAKKEIFLEVPD
jgi:hypothetical protein